MKWDGYRLAVYRDVDGVHIITRGGHDCAMGNEANVRFLGKRQCLDVAACGTDADGRLLFLRADLGGLEERSQRRPCVLPPSVLREPPSFEDSCGTLKIQNSLSFLKTASQPCP